MVYSKAERTMLGGNAKLKIQGERRAESREM